MTVGSQGTTTFLIQVYFHWHEWKMGSFLCVFYLFTSLITFNFEVVSTKAIGLEVEGEWCVGLVQEQVNPWQLDAVPLKHRTENLSGNSGQQRMKTPCTRQTADNDGPRCRLTLSSHLSVFFFIAGTISVLMSTLRSNFRLKNSLLGSCSGHTISQTAEATVLHARAQQNHRGAPSH